MEDYFIFISTLNERVCMERGRIVDENWRNFFFFFIKRIGNPRINRKVGDQSANWTCAQRWCNYPPLTRPPDSEPN